MLRHTRGCEAVAALIAEGFTGSTPDEWEYFADLPSKRPPRGTTPSRSIPATITKNLPEDLRKLAPDHVLLRWRLRQPPRETH